MQVVLVTQGTVAKHHFDLLVAPTLPAEPDPEPTYSAPMEATAASTQALSFGVPLVCTGLTEDKADENIRVRWSDAGINLETNAPRPVPAK